MTAVHGPARWFFACVLHTVLQAMLILVVLSDGVGFRVGFCGLAEDASFPFPYCFLIQGFVVVSVWSPLCVCVCESLCWLLFLDPCSSLLLGFVLVYVWLLLCFWLPQSLCSLLFTASLLSLLLETLYQSPVRVIHIIDPFDWYYEACTECHKTLDRSEQGLYCPDCRMRKRQFIPWYRIRIQVADQTDSAQFVLLGKTAETIIGADAVALKTKQDDNEHKPPQELLDIINKTYLFTVSGKQPGPIRKHRSYTVSRHEPVPDDMQELLPAPILLLQNTPHNQEQTEPPATAPAMTQQKAKDTSTTPPPETPQKEPQLLKRTNPQHEGTSVVPLKSVRRRLDDDFSTTSTTQRSPSHPAPEDTRDPE